MVRLDFDRLRRDVVNERGDSPRSEVSALVGCSEPMLCLVEQGKRKPNAELFLSLVQWLGRDISRYKLS